MKRIVFGVLMLLMFTLCGCGDKIKTEKEMQEDLQAHSNFWNAQEVTIEEFTLIKRQTDEKNKTDKAYVSVVAGNDKVECQIGYCLNYGLYDSGWILDSVSEFSEVEKKIIPKQGPTLEEAEAYLPEEEAMIKNIGEADLENGSCVVEYEKVETYPLSVRSTFYTSQFKFDQNSASWVSIEAEWTISEEWMIEGHWQGTRPKDDFLDRPEYNYDLYISNVASDGFDAEIYINDELIYDERTDQIDCIAYKIKGIIHFIYISQEEIKLSSEEIFVKVE